MTSSMIEHLRDVVVSVGAANVVIGDLPSLVLDCIALRPVDGYKSTYYFGTDPADEPLIEVVIRNKSYEVGQQLYLATSKALDRYQSEDNGIAACFLTGSPGYLGSDENGYHEWHMLFHVTIF